MALSLALAQQSSAGTLSWTECIELARRQNPELRAAERSLGAAEYRERGAYGAFLPQASVSLGYSQSSARLPGSLAGAATSSAGGSDSAYSASLSVSQNLFNGFADKGQLDQARANRAVSEATRRTTRARVAGDLKQAFAGLSYAQKAVKLSQEILERRRDNFGLVELRFSSGRENKGSVALSDAYFKQAELDLFQARNALDVSRSQMARVLGLDETHELVIDGSVPLEDPPGDLNLDRMAEATPDYQQVAAQERGAGAAVVVARGAFFPTLTVSGSVARTGDRFFPDNQRWSVGASLSLPLFQGGKDYYGLKGALESEKAAILTRENTLRQTRAKLHQALTTYREALKRYEVDSSFASASITRAMIAREKYNNGLLSFEDWDVIENDVITRRKALLQTERDRTVAEAAWQQAQGIGVFQ